MEQQQHREVHTGTPDPQEPGARGSRRIRGRSWVLGIPGGAGSPGISERVGSPGIPGRVGSLQRLVLGMHRRFSPGSASGKQKQAP